jgi:hypothetical protein
MTRLALHLVFPGFQFAYERQEKMTSAEFAIRMEEDLGRLTQAVEFPKVWRSDLTKLLAFNPEDRPSIRQFSKVRKHSYRKWKRISLGNHWLQFADASQFDRAIFRGEDVPALVPPLPFVNLALGSSSLV